MAQLLARLQGPNEGTLANPLEVAVDTLMLRIVVEGIDCYLKSDDKEMSMSEFLDKNQRTCIKLLVVSSELRAHHLTNSIIAYLRHHICGKSAQEVSDAFLIVPDLDELGAVRQRDSDDDDEIVHVELGSTLESTIQDDDDA